MTSKRLVLFAIFCINLAVVFSTPLDDYVNKPDASYKWSVERVYRGTGYTGYAIKLTSQTWLTPNDLDKYVWQHWLNVCVPDRISAKHHTAAIYVDGGSNPLGEAPNSLYEVAELLCVSSQSVTAHLTQVPNQPIYFNADPIRRTEDAFIAYTWAHFMNDTTKPEWLARLPMTKSVVRAMDAVQEFTSTISFVPKIHDFLIAGASKRGWTTWTTAAVDKRVKVIVPIVMPIVGMHDIIDEMYRVYGEWSFALDDYVRHKNLRYFGKPEFYKLASVVDPRTYIDRMDMLKYVVVASGDEFFLPDSTKFFWNKLKGPSYLRVLPNAEHTTIGSSLSVLLSADSLLQRYKEGVPYPDFNFKINYGNVSSSIIAYANGPIRPYVVKKWKATTLSTEKRDFRLLTCASPACINPVLWTSEILEEEIPGSGIYVAREDKPLYGWTGYMIEATFRLNDTKTELNPLQEFKVTTTVNVIPDVLPFRSCIDTDTCQPNEIKA